MQEHFESHGSVGIELTDTLDAEHWLKRLFLLYADDTGIVSNDITGFQTTLNNFNSYCQEWRLNVNVNKTKVVVFVARNLRNFRFKLGETTVEITNKYHYLRSLSHVMVLFYKHENMLCNKQK